MNNKKIVKDKLPVKDCIINNYFIGCNNPIKERLKYCQKNCGYKCLNGKSYKRR